MLLDALIPAMPEWPEGDNSSMTKAHRESAELERVILGLLSQRSAPGPSARRTRPGRRDRRAGGCSWTRSGRRPDGWPSGARWTSPKAGASSTSLRPGDRCGSVGTGQADAAGRWLGAEAAAWPGDAGWTGRRRGCGRRGARRGA